MAAVGFMFGVVRGDLSAGSVLAGITFLLLGAFLFIGTFNMSRAWDDEEEG
jgi:hypothetical protein